VAGNTPNTHVEQFAYNHFRNLSGALNPVDINNDSKVWFSFQGNSQAVGIGTKILKSEEPCDLFD